MLRSALRISCRMLSAMRPVAAHLSSQSLSRAAVCPPPSRLFATRSATARGVRVLRAYEEYGKGTHVYYLTELPKLSIPGYTAFKGGITP